jgi:hypothetical protein
MSIISTRNAGNGRYDNGSYNDRRRGENDDQGDDEKFRGRDRKNKKSHGDHGRGNGNERDD